MDPNEQKKRLAIYGRASSLAGDGARNLIHPADVSGRFMLWRRITFFLLIAFWIVLPWLTIGGRPLVFLDVMHRRFYLFGASYNAQDAWLLFFALAATLFGLVFATAALGRVWCGWTCPQTVFLEFVYRPIERLLEGPRNTRLKNDQAESKTPAMVAKKVLKHALYALVSFAIAHMILAYFVSIPSLWGMMTENPGAHPVAFVWAFGITGLLWFNFGWFREQTCLVICPYGRLQSVLMDDNSLIVGYDETRGEPRGKGKRPAEDAAGAPLGDCVECGRCVVVCPTGIDIRNGLQVDCIACTQCIDACDEIMDKVGRPRGLIRYDSLNGLRGKAKKFFRPRLAFYSVIAIALVIGAGFAFGGRAPIAANILRPRGMPYFIRDNAVVNVLQVHVVNRTEHPQAVRLAATTDLTGAEVLLSNDELRLEPFRDATIALEVRVPQSTFSRDHEINLVVRHLGHRSTAAEAHDDDVHAFEVHRRATLLGPFRVRAR